MANKFPVASECIERPSHHDPNARGRFGDYGGRVVPEALIPVIEEITEAFTKVRHDREFLDRLDALQSSYTGRPSPLYECTRLTDVSGTSFSAVPTARFFLKREDLNHTGSHKINNVLGQVLLAQNMGKKRVIAETGAGQHGVATATACALLGMECVIYMGAVDVGRQALNVARMRILGAHVVPVVSGSATLKDAINEAMRDWVSHVESTYYCFGTSAGPHPFPLMVRDFQRIIGAETRQQILDSIGRLPDAVFACVGGGSNAIGIFHAFLDDDGVQLYGCEAGGDGVESSRHAASISGGTPGYLHGAYSYLLQDSDGQIHESHSISAGLDYPGVGPEHSYLADSNRVKYFPVTDSQAMEAFGLLSRKEGIIPAIESAHAVAGALVTVPELVKNTANPVIIINISGRGDKDVTTAGKWFGILDDCGELIDSVTMGVS